MDGRLEDNLIFRSWRADPENACGDREDNGKDDDDEWRNWHMDDPDIYEKWDEDDCFMSPGNYSIQLLRFLSYDLGSQSENGLQVVVRAPNRRKTLFFE